MTMDCTCYCLYCRTSYWNAFERDDLSNFVYVVSSLSLGMLLDECAQLPGKTSVALKVQALGGSAGRFNVASY